VGAFAVEERSLICSAGGAGSGVRAIEGRGVVGWFWAPAEAMGSMRVAAVGVGVGWAELRIALERVVSGEVQPLRLERWLWIDI
jgi:hypothetical protein